MEIKINDSESILIHKGRIFRAETSIFFDHAELHTDGTFIIIYCRDKEGKLLAIMGGSPQNDELKKLIKAYKEWGYEIVESEEKWGTTNA